MSKWNCRQRPYSSGQRVGRKLVDNRSTVGRVSTDALADALVESDSLPLPKSAHCLLYVAFRICKLWQTYFILFRSEYLKIFDGNGTEVFALSGWLPSSKKTIHEISFGESKNITIQVSLVRSWSYIKIDYGTSNQGLDSGKEESKISKSSYF